MSIKTTNGEKFSFINEKGVESITPVNCDIYVHITDNSNGTHSAHAKIRRPSAGVGLPKTELDWHRGEAITFASDTPDLFLECHEAVKYQLETLNPNVTFIID